ncbi:MAG: nuclear transport factor 2 family protein [Verrucomicrobia bacterium]|nr:MAG: nuclear transport factor 2 family protein [Verrucomicrobiota bacterium]
MNIRLLPLAVSFAMFGVVATRFAMADDAISQDELVRRTQELFDAVVKGNAEPWKKYFADDCIFSDEKGRTLGKAAPVADITPLPRGYSGTIKIAKAQSIIHGDTAILSYDLDETETVFGQNLTARYHSTDTWLRRNGTWQIVATKKVCGLCWHLRAGTRTNQNRFHRGRKVVRRAKRQTRATPARDSGYLFP